ncbi:hypothetical protein T440DRAFT_465919 [Plenodomus tracheiphilus IPT5]|uniref:Uncharacterized protein n=1 Tax=Plenodomus tracheiphilus IPT5 TaxID=1408161 RepID=A0A6A7BDE3_9PLEO|nr:hypothetical protein T440DRAFT_465919 [Plenodomus tracheiphilus IPT5]
MGRLGRMHMSTYQVSVSTHVHRLLRAWTRLATLLRGRPLASLAHGALPVFCHAVDRPVFLCLPLGRHAQYDMPVCYQDWLFPWSSTGRFVEPRAGICTESIYLDLLAHLHLDLVLY